MYKLLINSVSILEVLAGFSLFYAEHFSPKNVLLLL